MNMLLTVRELRAIIAEAIGSEIDDRVVDFTRKLVTVSEKFVNSIVADTRDGQAAKELRALVGEAASYAKWLSGRKESKAEQFSQLVSYASEIAKSSGFWSTPTFLNKPQHTENMQKLFRRMQSLAGPLLTRIPKSGTYAKTVDPKLGKRTA